MTNGSVGTLWVEHRTTIIAGGVVAALVLGLIGVRVATGGGGDQADPGLTVDETPDAAGPTTTPTPSVTPSQTPSGSPEPGDPSASPAQPAGTTGDTTTGTSGGATTTTGDGGTTTTGTGSATTGGSAATATSGSTGGTTTRTPLPGVTDDEITVVYYWRGDRTRTSPYIQGSGNEGNVDEGDAFKKFIAYVNAHGGAGDDATFMGIDFDLHGRTLKGVVLEVGQDAESYAAATERIVNEIKPMVALTSTGSQSDYMCQPLADAGIHNFGVYDLQGSLAKRTSGYCTPAGIPFERQMDLSVAWLKRQQAAEPDRVYGLLYFEYPGLRVSGPILEKKLRDAGINLGGVATMTASLTDSLPEAAPIINSFRAAGVNTIVMPDGGSPLTFTHAAEANAYRPDYFVWPCSGQDTEGFVRLLNQSQWTRAEGLSCYDTSYVSDLTVTSTMTQAEWYGKYKEVAPNDAPPAQSPFVYASFLPLLQGVTAAGPDLTLETFRAGLDAFSPYRYDMIEGVTGDRTKVLIDYGHASRMGVADATTVRWNPARSGGSSAGRYDFLEDRRYAVPAEVR